MSSSTVYKIHTLIIHHNFEQAACLISIFIMATDACGIDAKLDDNLLAG